MVMNKDTRFLTETKINDIGFSSTGTDTGADLGRDKRIHVSLLNCFSIFFHHFKFYKIIEVPSRNLKIYKCFSKICLVPP